MCVHTEHRIKYLKRIMEELSKEKPDYDLLRKLELYAELYTNKDTIKINSDTVSVKEGKYTLIFKHDLKLPPKNYEPVLRIFLLSLLQASITTGGLSMLRKYLHEVSRACISKKVSEGLETSIPANQHNTE